MAIITLRNKIVINSASPDKNAIALIEETKPYLQGLPMRIWSSNKSLTWNNIKHSYPQPIKQIHYEITELANFYLKTLKPEFPNLLARHQIMFSKLEAEILKVNFENLNELEIAIHFFSKPYNLLQNFGHYLLLSEIEKNEENSDETFMVELNSDLSIHTYRI